MIGKALRHGPAVLLVMAAATLAGCDLNQNVYEPATFKQDCQAVKTANAAFPSFKGRYLAFASFDAPVTEGVPMHVFLKSMHYECDEFCVAAIRAGGHIVVRYDPAEFADHYRAIPRPQYLAGLAAGTYAFVYSSSRHCAQVAGPQTNRLHEVADYDGLAACISVKAVPAGTPILTVSPVADGATVGIAVSDANTRIAFYRNIYYSYPPGPSLQYCLEPRHYDAGGAAILDKLTAGS